MAAFVESSCRAFVDRISNEAQQINGSNQRQQLYSTQSVNRQQSASYVAAQRQLDNGFNSSRSAQHFRQRLQHHGATATSNSTWHNRSSSCKISTAADQCLKHLSCRDTAAGASSDWWCMAGKSLAGRLKGRSWYSGRMARADSNREAEVHGSWRRGASRSGFNGNRSGFSSGGGGAAWLKLQAERVLASDRGDWPAGGGLGRTSLGQAGL
ncbi:hypothetical protein J5N97_003170 [Dioscorea zingiberensis]|uniref:Uncharacterized protein n=1 Tax=Dioscorea zingiberensis TaxID=325984 RepID=A0A9D5HQ38_9LILI|nr:hypothetical protein J5N97_003170 [Dioscorea zingiberensis]